MAPAISTHLLNLAFCSLCLLSTYDLPHAAYLSFTYNFSDPTTLEQSDLGLEGDAMPRSSSVELTNVGGLANRVGRMSHTRPVPLRDDATGEEASFKTTFSFLIRADNGSFRGDGLAFFLMPYPSRPPPYSSGGFLGLFTNPSKTDVSGAAQTTVAVEFDTFHNPWDPPGTGDHIGINVNNVTSTAFTPLLEGHLVGRLTAWIEYNHSTTTLSVALRHDDRPTLSLYNLSACVNLRRLLPEGMAAVGISAATGGHAEVHQILLWNFSSTLDPKEPPSQGNIAARVATGVALLLLLSTVAGFLLWRRWTMETLREAEFERGTWPRRFPYNKLADATATFAEENKLGQGGFGPVYRGYLKEQGRRVAIKVLSPESSEQGRREFEAEVKIISRLRHRNLIQLAGWCDSRKGLFLVYELVPRASLDKHLYNTDRLLTWPERYNIVLGLGSALHYLHAGWEQCVVHGDIKPSNILLDASYNAKLGDFGLARLMDHGNRLQTTQVVAGTRGYVDPEFLNTGKPCTESDVYSFGIVLLEIACGRRPVVEQEDKVSILLRSVWELYGRKELLLAADRRLNGEFDLWEMERVLVVGMWCAHPNQSERPSVVQAMQTLQSRDARLPILPQHLYGLAPPRSMEILVEARSSVHSAEETTYHTSTVSTSLLSGLDLTEDKRRLMPHPKIS